MASKESLMSKKRILLVADVRGWAYDDRAKNWASILSESYDIEILYLSDHPASNVSYYGKSALKNLQESFLRGEPIDVRHLNNMYKKNLFDSSAVSNIIQHEKYDGIMFFYSRALLDSRLFNTHIPSDKVAVCINNEKWDIEPGNRRYWAADFWETYGGQSKLIVACNKYIFDSFSNMSGANSEIMRASQSVNDGVFFPIKGLRKNETLTLGFSGNKHNPIKRFDVIAEACKEAGAVLSVAKYDDRGELNKWYSRVDAVICGSLSEGGPMCILESGAAKVPLISVKVGLGREILNDENCLIIKNNNNNDIFKENIKKKIKLFTNNKEKGGENEAMSERLHQSVISEWTYSARSYEIKRCMEYLVGREDE